MKKHIHFILLLSLTVKDGISQSGPMPQFYPSNPPPMVPLVGERAEPVKKKEPQLNVRLFVGGDNGKGIPGAVVYLYLTEPPPSKARSNGAPRLQTLRPPKQYLATANTEGMAMFSSLEPGNYRACFEAPAPFLNPCEWAQYPRIQIPDGPGTGLERNISLNRGRLLSIIVGYGDERKRVAHSSRVAGIVPLRVGFIEPSGRYHDFGLGTSTEQGISFQSTIPEDASGWPVAYANDVEFQLQDGRRVPGGGGRAPTWSELERQAGKFTFRAVPVSQ